MHSLTPFLCLVGIALAYVALGIFALRNPGPDPEDCGPDCEFCIHKNQNGRD
jgi:hypothetical protein